MSQENFDNSEEYMARYGVGCQRCQWADWSPVRNCTRFFEGCSKGLARADQRPRAQAGTRRYAIHSFEQGVEGWRVTPTPITEEEVTRLLEEKNSQPGCASRAFAAGEIDLESDGDGPWVAYDEEDRVHEVPEWVVAELSGFASLPAACSQYRAQRGLDEESAYRLELPPHLEADIEKWEQGQAHWSVSNSVIRGFVRKKPAPAVA